MGQGGQPDINSMMQAMQNPAMQQMVQNVMSQPGMMETIANNNPQLRAMMDANPQVRCAEGRSPCLPTRVASIEDERCEQPPCPLDSAALDAGGMAAAAGTACCANICLDCSKAHCKGPCVQGNPEQPCGAAAGAEP